MERIAKGTRFLSLERLAYARFLDGWCIQDVYDEISRVNELCCDPPTGGKEVRKAIAAAARSVIAAIQPRRAVAS